MKNTYPVFFTKTDDVVLVEVPDLEILTEGKDMPDAIRMARDAIGLNCIVKEDLREVIPEPSNAKDLDITKGAFYKDGETTISYIDIDSEEYRRELLMLSGPREKGKCRDCGLSMPDSDGKGPYKFFCTTSGKRKRRGDSCDGFWEKEKMKQFIDETIEILKKN